MPLPGALQIVPLKKLGLCNRLFDFFTACDIAIKTGVKVIEPDFGSQKHVLFSEIYDLKYFNETMKKWNKNEYLIVPYQNMNEYSLSPLTHKSVWDISEKKLRLQRNNCHIEKSCSNVRGLSCLKLNSIYDRILESYNLINKSAIHLRIEDDWVKYSKLKKAQPDEVYLTNIETLMSMYKDFSRKDVFFTTGMNQQKIKSSFSKNNINVIIYRSSVY